jgi:acetoin:2,6-dichlorophenolindophenol oxidoreductase subunit alpha
MDLGKEKLINMLQMMLTIREFEMSVDYLFKEGRVVGAVHLSTGQEASAVGVVTVLEKNDYIFTHHRGHGHQIVKGLDIKKMMAELWGKSTGNCKGKSGSMHLMDIEHNAMGANGILAMATIHVNGTALYSKIYNTKQISVAFLGDGSANQGSVHEGMNLASIWKLPCIFVLENNHYAEATPVEYACNIKDLSERASGYGIASLKADGSDVLDIYDKTTQAVNRARNGDGPTLLVVDLYRYAGHYVGDPEGYRSKEEIEEHMENDCILKFKNHLKELGYINEEDFIKMKEKSKVIIEEAIKFADESPLPEVSETYTDVYV